MARLLIVGDDPDLGETLREILVEEGHLVRLTGTGLEAREQVTAHRPDLVLFDVRPPALSEPEGAFGTFRGDTGLNGIPVILLSGVRELPGIARAIGTPYFLMKPFWLEELLPLVSRALAEN